MNSMMSTYDQDKRAANRLQRRIRYPLTHSWNLPSTVDLRPLMTEIEDQGGLNSCVSNAIAGALEYIYKAHTGQHVDVSRLFIDFNARISNLNLAGQQAILINRNDPNNSFTTNRNAAIRGLQQYGFCEELLWPYDPQRYMSPPPRKVYVDARRRSIIPLKVPVNVDSVRTCLAHGIPVLIGIALSSDEAYHNRGYVQVPKIAPNEGWHACLVAGYDDRSQHFIIRNSWGRQWGDKGYCYVPYAYLMDRRLVVTDIPFWAIAKIVPREQLPGPGYVSYPNFTQYHNQRIRKHTDRERQQQLHRYRQGRRIY